MNYNRIKKKIKGQKSAAIFLIIGAMIALTSYFRKNNFEMININDYLIVCSLIVLIICGSIGLKNSLWKEKQLKK